MEKSGAERWSSGSDWESAPLTTCPALPPPPLLAWTFPARAGNDTLSLRMPVQGALCAPVSPEGLLLLQIPGTLPWPLLPGRLVTSRCLTSDHRA